MEQSWSETVASASTGGATINPYQRLNRSRGLTRVNAAIPRDMGLVDKKLRRLFRHLLAAQEPWPLYLHGLQGRGKTLATMALCDAVAGSRYFTPSELMDTCACNSHYLPWGATGRRYPIDLSVLDEVGADVGSGMRAEWHKEMVRLFCDHREQYHHRVAVYVSNLPPELIREKYDDRVASRMLCGTLYELTGVDRRQPEPGGHEAAVKGEF